MPNHNNTADIIVKPKPYTHLLEIFDLAALLCAMSKNNVAINCNEQYYVITPATTVSELDELSRRIVDDCMLLMAQKEMEMFA